jgi:ADP-ribosylglycohydrolase
MAIQAGRRFNLALAARDGPDKEILPNFASGYVLETLIIAIASVLDPRSLEDVLVDVVRIGKDTDTNGAVAGGLLGARDGEQGIPLRWKNILQFSNEFREVSLETLLLIEKGLRGPTYGRE